MRHLISLFDLSASDIEEILDRSAALKAELKAGKREPLLQGTVLALLFEKQSLRTRVSFETGMTHLGGSSLYLGEDVGWGTREPAKDFAQVLSEYVDIVACRAKSHSRVEELAKHATCPIINALTDYSHPCQALADVMTLLELQGELKGKKIAYIGDGNNVARSLAIACGKLGIQLTVCAPNGYQLESEFCDRLQAEVPNASLELSSNPHESVQGADAVYTDVWASMGQESEREKRIKDFADYQVNGALMAKAPSHCNFLHCLPARRGEEVTAEVADGPNSAIIQQAANRLHAQKGLVTWLLGK